MFPLLTSIRCECCNRKVLVNADDRDYLCNCGYIGLLSDIGE